MGKGSFFSTKIYRDHIDILLSELGHSELFQRLFEKMTFFGVDPLFKVSSVGSRRWHQSESGNLSSTPDRIEMKWALNVCMALSAWLRLCCPGGTSSYSMLFA